MSQVSREITEFKADDPEGLFAAKVSVFGNTDRDGDRVMPGAFDRTIEIWRSSGKKIPVVWSHEHKNPDAFIGYVDPNDVRITDEGVTVAGKLDVKGNPLAMRAFNLLSDGLVGEWSFAYKVNSKKMAADGAREIYDLDLFELGPTLIGSNAETLTLATKEAAVLDAPMNTTVTPPPNVTITLGEQSVTTSTVPTTHEPTKIAESVDDAVASLETELDTLIEEKIGKVISRRSAEKIRAAVAQLNELLSSALDGDAVPVEGSSSEEKATEPPPPPSEDELRRAELKRMGRFLEQRGR